MKKLVIAALAALALVCLPVVLHAQAFPDPDVGGQIGTVVDAARAHDWQLALAAALGLLAWALRRFVVPTHFFHTEAGAVLITGGCATIGAIVPVLQAHAFTVAALVGAVTSGVIAAVAVANPTMASKEGARAVELLLLLVGLGLVSSAAGCACFNAASSTYASSTCVAQRSTAATEAKCVLDQLPKEVLDLVPSIIEIASGQQPDWEAQLAQLEARGGATEICAEEAAMSQLADVLPNDSLAARVNLTVVDRKTLAITRLIAHAQTIHVALHPLVVSKLRAHAATRGLLDPRHSS